jgi:hypothetical protein
MSCRFNDAIRSGRIHHIEAIDNCCILAAVGQQMASRKGVSATMFSALAKSNINIRYGSTAWPPHRPAVRASDHLAPSKKVCLATKSKR